ncbi:MAG: MBL fold metallo-hydrolase [Candidatus Rokubacteria bacterium]|nr:MBL fold metallo-hydrolase [Candidatus Rokubacteria bacterium]
MGAIRELAERFWRGEIPPRELWKPTGQVEEIADGVVFLHAFANVNVLRAGDGLVLIDTSNYQAREKTFAAVRAIDPARLHIAVYTHGHADHACGMPPFLAEAEAKKWARPHIVGHRAVAARFDRYRATNGYNALINARQFGIAPTWPTEYDYPDTTYETSHVVKVGDTMLVLHHARGGADDHTWLWHPDSRTLFTGDLFIWVTPNAGNPAKVQRYAAEWAVALRAMAALDPDVLVPGHGVPIFGADRVRQALVETAEWLEAIVTQTVAAMNAGATLETIVRDVKPPAHLATRPYLQPVYDEPDYVVRNLWRLYGGWYDGVPSHLKPAGEAQLGREVAALAGGLIDWAVAVEPDNRDAHAVRADIYTRRAAGAAALMTRGIFTAAANESKAKSP